MSTTSTAVLFDIIGRDSTGKALGSAGTAFNKLALGIAASAAFIGVKMVDAAGNFQAGMVRLQTGAGELQSNLAAVGDGTLKLMGQIGISAHDATTALYTIESGGQHGADALTVLAAAGEGAKAEMADVTEVADALTSVLQDYHLKASDAALVTSQMVTAVGMGKTTFQLFAQSLHSILPLASSSHVAFADIAGALASMTVHGMSADQASQNLADTLKHMVAPTGVQVRELGQLGVSASSLADMVSQKGLTGTLQFLSQTIMQHMGPAGRVLLSAWNQSTDAAKDANAMIAAMSPSMAELAKRYQAGTIGLNDWRQTLKGLPAIQAQQLAQFAALQANASGFSSILRAGGPAAQSYQDALRRVTGDATGLSTALMLTGENTEYTNKAVAAVAGASTEAGNHIKGWSEVQATFNQRLSQARGTVAALGIRIGTGLLPPAQAILNVVMDSVGWFGKHNAIAHTLAVTMGTLAAVFVAYRTYVTLAAGAEKAWAVAKVVWTGVTKAAAAAQWLFNAALDASPIGLVILAIGALVVGFIYLWKHSKAFRDFWIGLWHVISSAALWVWHNVLDPAWHGIAAGALWLWHNVLEPAWQGISASFSFAWRIISSIFNLWLYFEEKRVAPVMLWLWHNIIDPVWHGIAAGALWLWHNVLDPLWHGIVVGVNVVAKVTNWMHKTLRDIWGHIADIALWLWHHVLDPAWHGIDKGIHWLVDGAKKVFGGMADVVSGAFHAVVGNVKGSINIVIGLINDAIHFIDHDFIDNANKIPGVNFPHIPSIPSLASGGIVRATPGGRIVRLAEGGRDEAVVPLGRGGAGKSDVVKVVAGDALIAELIRHLAKAIRDAGGDGSVLNIVRVSGS